MYAFAFFPRSVPCATLCRKMLPVDICGTPMYGASFAAWVPLPAPGGPRRTSLMSRRERSQRSKDFGTPRVGDQPVGKNIHSSEVPSVVVVVAKIGIRGKGKVRTQEGIYDVSPQTTNGSWFPGPLTKDPDAFGTATSRICSRSRDKVS